MKPLIYVLFALDLDGECKFIKNIIVIKEICSWLSPLTFLYTESPIHPITVKIVTDCHNSVHLKLI